MALYKDGNPVSGLNSIPRLTLAQYNALTTKPEFWVRTDAPESYKKLSADQVSYDSNNTVKDKIDSMVFPKKIYSVLNANAKSVNIENGQTYLLTITGGGNGVNSSVAIVNKRYQENPVVLQWLLNGVGANETSINGNTVTCSLTGYNYQMTLTQLS